jgi:hypothetical protein
MYAVYQKIANGLYRRVAVCATSHDAYMLLRHYPNSHFEIIK